MRSSSFLLPLVALTGCPWIGAEQLDERLDADGDGYASVDVGGTDCDDADPAIHPAAVERCDGIDDDCDGIPDDGTDEAIEGGQPYAFDGDRDGYGQQGGAVVQACSAPEGFAATADDCDDGDAAVRPGADERCNGRDDDCDGTTDEEPIDGEVRYADADGDSYGDPATAIAVCSPDGTVANGLDCDDTDPSRNPDTSWYADGDGDGYGDAARFVQSSCEGPRGAAANPDDCDDSDAAKNPDTVWYADLDSDGYGGQAVATQCDQPPNALLVDGDCDDTDDRVNPATEWYEDADGDGYTGTVLSPPSCVPPAGGTLDPTDCDDSDDAVSPDGVETCNGIDDDCDERRDDADVDTPPTDATLWYFDDDGDGWGSGSPRAFCDPPNPFTWSDVDGDCNDLRPTQHPETVWVEDVDRDGYWPDDGPTLVQCEKPSNDHRELELVLDDPFDIDCDDSEPTTHPRADESCDDVDSDCDGDLNDDDSTGERTWWRDDDLDGYGDSRFDTLSCFQPPGYADNPDDCDDDRDIAYPGALDPCYDGEDLDCDGDDEDDCDGDGFLRFADGGEDCDDNDPFVSPALPTSRTVPGDHATIQEALDAACPYDAVLVDAGTFPEILVAPRPVHLLGAGSGATVIDGGGAGPVLTFEGGTVDGLTLTNGVAGTGGCLDQSQGEPVTVRDVELASCYATNNGGCVHLVGVDYTLDGVHLSDCTADTYGGGLDISSGDGQLVDVTCTDCVGLSGGAVYLTNADVDITRLTLVRPAGLASVFLGAVVGGTWTDLHFVQAESITSGLLLTGAGSTAPLWIDGLRMDAPRASDGGTFAVWAAAATDLTLTDIVVTDGDVSGSGLFPPTVLNLGVATGDVVVSGIRVQNTPGSSRLETSLSQGSILLEHGTFVEGDGGLVLDAAAPDNLVVRNTVVAYDRGPALTIEGAPPTIEGTVLHDNLTDWPVGTLYDGVDGNSTDEPGFLTWGPSLLPSTWDLRLGPNSRLRDAGIGFDLDGSEADIGSFGGPAVHAEDLFDGDGDGLYDDWELRHGLDPAADSRLGDPDGDGLTNEEEADHGTFPDVADTDGDGLDDGTEVASATSPVDGSDP